MFTNAKIVLASAIISLGGPAVAGDIVLTISGNVANPAEGEAWSFDRAELRDLPTTAFQTTTIWTEGPQSFEGVQLDVLLEHVGAKEGTLRAVALNDYAVMIPFSDAVEGGPIVAYARNGAEMSVRDKGPLWIIYPFDDNQTYKSEDYYSRSIWQLDHIEIIAEQ